LWVHYTTSYKIQSRATEDGQNNFPKHVELTGIINKPLLLHLVGCLYLLYFIIFLRLAEQSQFIPLQNVVYFITLAFLVRKIFTCYINDVLLFKFHFQGQRVKIAGQSELNHIRDDQSVLKLYSSLSLDIQERNCIHRAFHCKSAIRRDNFS